MDNAERLKNRDTWRDGWQTRDGRAVEIVWDDLGGKFPVGGRVKNSIGAGWNIEMWMKDGRYSDDQTSCYADLVPRPVRHSGWIVFERLAAGGITGTTYAWTVPPRVDGRPEVVAVVPYSFTEGDGLL